MSLAVVFRETALRNLAHIRSEDTDLFVRTRRAAALLVLHVNCHEHAASLIVSMTGTAAGDNFVSITPAYLRRSIMRRGAGPVSQNDHSGVWLLSYERQIASPALWQLPAAFLPA